MYMKKGRLKPTIPDTEIKQQNGEEEVGEGREREGKGRTRRRKRRNQKK